MHVEMENTQRFDNLENLTSSLNSLEDIHVMAPSIARLKQKAHDFGVSQHVNRKNLSASQVSDLVNKHASFFVGQNEYGERFIFGIPVPLKSRDGSPVPTNLILARDKTMQKGFLKAVIGAQQSGQIDTLTAERETQKVLALNFSAGRVLKDPIEAGFELDLKNQPDSNVQRARAIALTTAGITANAAIDSHKKGSKTLAKVFLGTSIGSVIVSACAPIIMPSSEIIPTPVKITPVPTLTEQNVLSGTGEFTNGDASLPTSLKELLSKSFNIEIPIEATVPFAIEVGGAKFDFVSLAPLENKEFEISWNEKLFMRVDNTMADLDRKVVTINGKTLVLWSYLNKDGVPEPVLWYPSLTEEQWKGMTTEQKKDFYAGFAPPSPLESKIPGFIRSSNKMFAISFAGLPDGAQKVLASLAKPFEATTIQVEAPLPAGTMIPVEAKEIAEATADFLNLDAEGNGTISIAGSEPISYHSKDTIFKVAGEPDLLIIASWEYKLVDGKYEYQGPRQVFAPDGVPTEENLKTYPSIDPRDFDLLNHYRSQTNNPNIFDELPVARKNLKPDHYWVGLGYDKGATRSTSKIMFVPNPGDGTFRFAELKSAFPVWKDTKAPIVHIIGKGYSLPVAFLDSNNTIVWTNGIISEKTFLSLDMSIARRDKDYFKAPYLSVNDPEHQELINATANLNNGLVKTLPSDLMSKVYFNIIISPEWLASH